MNETVYILLVAAGAGLGVGALGLLAAWLLRRRSLRWQFSLVAIVATATVLAGVVAIAQLMFLSSHDLRIVMVITAAAVLTSLAVAAIVAEAVVRWSRQVQAHVRGIGGGLPIEAAPLAPSEFSALAGELAIARQRLEEAASREARLEESRRELVSWVSHDLRTPLAGIRAMAESLEDGMAADPPRYHRQIRQEVERMTSMVDDLFELSRIHAGVLQLQPEMVLLSDLISEAIAGADPVARTRQVRLGGAIDADIQVGVDPAGISRVLSNLIVNAIRHTPADGSVHVHARPLPHGVELSVVDSCGGIEEDTMGRVFDVAFRGAEARTPDAAPDPHAGTRAGLGLAIVKGIVEAHSGRVDVVNVADAGGVVRGCRFVVQLPSTQPAG